MSAIVLGRYDWGMSRDKDGHRDYKIKWLMQTDDTDDGPAIVSACTDLPLIGDYWAYGNDADPWAFCWPTLEIQPTFDRERNPFWLASQTFSTRPFKRCQDDSIENPLSEPMRLSGSFIKFTKEATVDKDGKAIRSSSHEMLRGAAVEFDDNRPTVNVGMNLMSLPLSTFAPMVDTVNDATLWGLSARMVKLANVKWNRLVYGTCTYYYTVDYEFEVNYLTFDRYVLDEGAKCLIGWAPGSRAAALDPDAGSPANHTKAENFEVYKDKNGENARCLLDSKGRPLSDGDSPHEILVAKYTESNFLDLGVPTSL